MKDIKTYINESSKNNSNSTGDSWVAIEVIMPNDNSENGEKTKRSKRVVSYNTYMNMKNSGQSSNGSKIISVTTIGASVASREKAEEYIHNKK